MTATFSITISGKGRTPTQRPRGIPSQALHTLHASGLVGTTRNLASFASGAAQVLVATDIAARGIHVDGIPLVIRADPPAEHKA